MFKRFIIALLLAMALPWGVPATALAVGVVRCSHSATDPATWTNRELAAQMTFFGIPASRPSRAEALAAKGVGGVVILGRDAPRDLGAHVRAAGVVSRHGVRLFVASDEEGGRVQRLQDLIFPLPSARRMGTWSNTRVKATAKHYGSHLRQLGVRVVFGPVADLDVPGRYMSNLDRCFSSRPLAVAARTQAWTAGMRETGVVSVLKHWPGGGHAGNTHAGGSYVPRLSALEAADMIPFERAFARRTNMVMVGHVVSIGLTEPRTPVSLSPKALSYLRSRTGSDTVIITDSLSMSATTKALGISTSTAVIRSLRAGADSALVCTGDPDTIIAAVTTAIGSGRIPRQRAVESVRRILRLKARMGIAPPRAGALPVVPSITATPTPTAP